jgi:hypothetical protein
MASVNRPDANPTFFGPSDGRPKLDDWFAELLREQVPGNAGQFVMVGNNESKTQTLWSIKIDYTITY